MQVIIRPDREAASRLVASLIAKALRAKPDLVLRLVTGRTKAGVLARAVEGPVSSMISASAIQLHPDCTVVADEEAAAGLEAQEYYRWIFANEPEWEEFR